MQVTFRRMHVLYNMKAPQNLCCPDVGESYTIAQWLAHLPDKHNVPGSIPVVRLDIFPSCFSARLGISPRIRKHYYYLHIPILMIAGQRKKGRTFPAAFEALLYSRKGWFSTHKIYL